MSKKNVTRVALLFIVIVSVPFPVAGQINNQGPEPLPKDFMAIFYKVENLYHALPDKQADVMKTNDPRCHRVGRTHRAELEHTLQQLVRVQQIVDNRPIVSETQDSKITAAIHFVVSNYRSRVADLAQRLRLLPEETGVICKIEKRANDVPL